MKKSLIITLFVFGVILFGCNSNTNTKNTETKEPDVIGRVVYIDRSRILHVDRTCFSLRYQTFDNSDNRSGAKYVAIENLCSNDFDYYCTRCVSDEAFKKLDKIIIKNDGGFSLGLGWGEEEQGEKETDW